MYYQMTLNDWMAIKDSLRDDLRGVSQSFVRIGYKLRKIEEQKLYEQDGYKSLADFAKAEYGLSQSTTSRFMAINAKYSIGGYGETLRPEFEELGSSKLSEMLTLPDHDLEMITPETPREAIRELKNFEKSKPVYDGVELITALIEANRETIDEWYRGGLGAELLKELLNPAGTRTFRKGVWFLLMYEADVKVKKFPEAPKSMTWAELADKIYEAYEPEEEHAQEPEQDDREVEQNAQEAVHEAHAEDGGLHEGDILPPPESEERSKTQEHPEVVEEPEETEADAVGVCEPREDHPAVETEVYAPAHKEEKNEAEMPHEVLTRRWEYMKTLDTTDLAEYMIRKHQEKSISTLDLMAVERMAEWLDTMVDEHGDEEET